MASDRQRSTASKGKQWQRHRAYAVEEKRPLAGLPRRWCAEMRQGQENVGHRCENDSDGQLGLHVTHLETRKLRRNLSLPELLKQKQKYHRLSDLKNKKLFFTVLEA